MILSRQDMAQSSAVDCVSDGYAKYMEPREPADSTARRYSSLAEAYIELFGRVEQAEAEDLELITQWAQEQRGPVLDAGCGPGHWTHVISGPGRPANGVDMVPQFLEHAKSSYPDCTFLQADITSLPFPDDSFFRGLGVVFDHPHAARRPAVNSEFADEGPETRRRLIGGLFRSREDPALRPQGGSSVVLACR